MMKKIQLIFFLFLFLFLPYSVKAEEKVVLHFFHGNGCPHCAEEEKFLKEMKDEYNFLEIIDYEVWYDEDNETFFKDVREALEVEKIGVPTTVIGDTVFVGYNDVLSNKIRRAIEFYHNHGYIDAVSKIKDGTFNKEELNNQINDEASFQKEEDKLSDDLTISVPIFKKVNLKNVSLMTAAVLIGWIDGFNPCAMWVLLFLISVLIGIKDRKRMWILGLAFLFTSAFVYMLLMLSWVSIVVKITMIVWIRRIISILALVGGLWNLRSFAKTSDSGCEVVDDKRRKSILKRIRKFTSEKSFIISLLGIMALAVSVNVIELACSAGLPLIFTEVLALNKVSTYQSIFYTLIYIIFFLLDDFLIFFIAMFTMKVTGISSKYNKYSHLLGGIIMLVVGILLLFKPEWLMFQFK